MKLYEVTLKSWKEFYVLANGLEDAVRKVKEHLDATGESTNILTSDGSLKSDKELEEIKDKLSIKRIQIIADKILK